MIEEQEAAGSSEIRLGDTKIQEFFRQIQRVLQPRKSSPSASSSSSSATPVHMSRRQSLSSMSTPPRAAAIMRFSGSFSQSNSSMESPGSAVTSRASSYEEGLLSWELLPRWIAGEEASLPFLMIQRLLINIDYPSRLYLIQELVKAVCDYLYDVSKYDLDYNSLIRILKYLKEENSVFSWMINRFVFNYIQQLPEKILEESDLFERCQSLMQAIQGSPQAVVSEIQSGQMQREFLESFEKIKESVAQQSEAETKISSTLTPQSPEQAAQALCVGILGIVPQKNIIGIAQELENLYNPELQNLSKELPRILVWLRYEREGLATHTEHFVYSYLKARASIQFSELARKLYDWPGESYRNVQYEDEGILDELVEFFDSPFIQAVHLGRLYEACLPLFHKKLEELTLEHLGASPETDEILEFCELISKFSRKIFLFQKTDLEALAQKLESKIRSNILQYMNYPPYQMNILKILKATTPMFSGLIFTSSVDFLQEWQTHEVGRFFIAQFGNSENFLPCFPKMTEAEKINALTLACVAMGIRGEPNSRAVELVTCFNQEAYRQSFARVAEKVFQDLNTLGFAKDKLILVILGRPITDRIKMFLRESHLCDHENPLVILQDFISELRQEFPEGNGLLATVFLENVNQYFSRCIEAANGDLKRIRQYTDLQRQINKQAASYFVGPVSPPGPGGTAAAKK